MILVPCPHCGPRNSSEFRFVGEPHARPDVATATPEAWNSYLYLKDNPAGWQKESWYHRAGCRRYFAIERHTVTNERRPATGVGEEAAADNAGVAVGANVAEGGGAVDATQTGVPGTSP